MSSPTLPPDQAARERILRDLDATLLVEAAAGTGKTTSLVGRMVALIASGRCGVETLAAVTFTRKAAAELRGRFSAELERAAREAEGTARGRLAAAASHPERCFIGTIHSFCARLLRERPIEAGVDVAFAEVEEAADALLREEAWEAFVARLFAADPPDPRLDRLAALGLEIGRLREAFLAYAAYPDVEEWPAPEVEPGDLPAARAELARYLGHIARLRPTFPEERGSDKLMARYERIARTARLLDLGSDAGLMEALEPFAARHGATQKCWPGGREQARREIERYEDFAGRIAVPLLARWRERRYAAVIPLLGEAAREYDALRAARGVLNYQDLLLRAARLLRDRPQVRRYFRERFTHLLVDEFQDTDPLQAEVALYLTADDPEEREWRRCRPVAGSLVVVGDPKQSIYRFRRADIVTYQQMREVILAAGGAVVALEANFRSLPELIGWGNGVFAPPVFPRTATTHAPAAHPLAAGRPESAGDLAGLWTVVVPEGAAGTNDAAAAHDADRIARFIRHALDAGLTVARTPREIAAGVGAAAAPGDFLIVTWTRKRLDRYAAALQGLGIPHEVSGGSAWRQVEELRLLAGCLRALVEPEDPVALVAALRGGLFGLSDAELYAFRRAGGRFRFDSPVPAALAPAAAARISEAFSRLRRCVGWLRTLPPVAALERIAGDLGLLLRALLAAGGDVRAGSIGKAFALLRGEEGAPASVSELAGLLESLIEKGVEFDGLSARAAGPSAVRVMNLHRAKGLEAPVVFLADPGGLRECDPVLHVDRGGGRITGHLLVREKSGRAASVLAQPPGWDALAAAEGAFADAERTRLRYVAATRAGAMLSTTLRAKRADRNPWEFFAPALAGAGELPDPGPQQRPAVGRIVVEEAEVAAAEAAIAERWEHAAGETYAVRGAKEVAVSAAELRRRATPEAGEHGTEWGTVIHFLLETAMREPDRDLADLARSALEEQGLDPGRAGEALATVSAVRASELWARASSSGAALVEVPFTVALAPGDALLPEPAELPTLVRGVVDLAFRGAGGWVIADWKTDAAPGPEALEALARRYAPQVRLYAGIWSRITGEPVVECGLFFTAAQRYVPLPVARRS